MENGNFFLNLVKYQKCITQYTGTPLSRVTPATKKGREKKSNITYDKAHTPSPIGAGGRRTPRSPSTSTTTSEGSRGPPPPQGPQAQEPTPAARKRRCFGLELVPPAPHLLIAFGANVWGRKGHVQVAGESGRLARKAPPFSYTPAFPTLRSQPGHLSFSHPLFRGDCFRPERAAKPPPLRRPARGG